MDLLLDSHIALWWVDDPDRLTRPSRDAIAEPANEVWFSAASAWELSIKVRARKLDVDVDSLVRRLSENGVALLGIGIDHAIGAGALDWDHRDPFDRLLVTQARRQGLVLATRDAEMLDFLGDRALRS